MTHGEAAALVKRLTYRPGWTIEFYPVPGASVLRVGVTEPDTEVPGHPPRPVVYTDAIDDEKLGKLTDGAFLRWVYEVFHKRVVHELNEWLRLDGAPLVEPHPEQGWKRGVLEHGEAT